MCDKLINRSSLSYTIIILYENSFFHTRMPSFYSFFHYFWLDFDTHMLTYSLQHTINSIHHFESTYHSHTENRITYGLSQSTHTLTFVGKSVPNDIYVGWYEFPNMHRHSKMVYTRCSSSPNNVSIYTHTTTPFTSTRNF